MYLDYTQLTFDKTGMPDPPELVLQTLDGESIGIVSGAHNLRFHIKFSEPSEISFDVPATLAGNPNPIYNKLTGHMLIYTKNYGIYMLMNPSTEADGISEVKHIQGYSLEKTLENKKFFLEEGTFKFYDAINPQNKDTVIGHILEIAIGWKIGYISPTIGQKYRTFTQYDDYLLSFLYNTAPEKYRCVFVFDPYKKTINVYDADEELQKLPIYLDFDNLLKSVTVEEQSDQMATAIRPYGADGLDIREVNPIGTDWIYDLGYFIAKGDIPDSLAKKWQTWQQTVQNNRTYFEGLSALCASATTQINMAENRLQVLKDELQHLTEQQNLLIQQQANEVTNEGKNNIQKLLDDVNGKILTKKNQIKDQEQIVTEIKEHLDTEKIESYAAKREEIVNQLDIKQFFTAEEYAILANYFIEQDITEDTFIATDIDTATTGNEYTLSNETIQIQNSTISKIDLTKDFGKTIYMIKDGIFSLNGSYSLSSDIIRGTLELSTNGDYVLSLYAGSIKVKDITAETGVITLSGKLSGLTDDILAITKDDITTYIGANLSFSSTDGAMYMTTNVSDYKQYAVEQELYDYGVSLLSDLATPTYEFSVDSANFLFSDKFAPFRNKLELGKGVYLNIGHKQLITPYIIEFELDFEDRSSFSLIFSNQFKRSDNVNTLKSMLEKSYSTSRSFDASKYIYNQVSNQASQVSAFMKGSLDAAVNNILAAANQSIIINGAGIHVGGDSPYQIRIVDNMIAMSDDNWATAKMALGHFASEDIGSYFGVNAEVIGGKLIVGNNLVIENETDNGVMQFKVDSSGAWLNNSTFVLQKDNGGKILIDPKYGIAAGEGNLYQVDGTTVLPSFIDENGNMIKENGFPKNAKFYIDMQDGSAYFKGSLVATSGEIGGFTIADDYLYTGSGGNFVGLNGSGTNEHAQYAMWAGGSTPNSAKFWLRKDGSIKAAGTIDATDFLINGRPALENNKIKSDYLDLGNIKLNGTKGDIELTGNIYIGGNIDWGTSNNGQVLTLYNAEPGNGVPYGIPYSDFGTTRPKSGHNGHHRELTSNDNYACYSYDGGETWSDEVRISGEDEESVFNILTDGGTRFGVFKNPEDGELVINANYIRTGVLDAGRISLSNNDGGFCVGYGDDGSGYTTGAKMYGSGGKSGNTYIIVTEAGCRMSAGKDYLFVQEGNIEASRNLPTGSDRRIKNSIDYDMEKYKNFFLALKPVQYRLNRENGRTFYTGFIAQDVELALLENNLSQEDFAGLSIVPVTKGSEKDGITDQFYRLDYSQFISLNTYMIQQLIAKNDALEAEINKLKEFITNGK